MFSLSNLFWPLQPSVAQISPGCGTPGQDGSGTITGIVNTYFPPSGNGNLSAGATSITVGAAQGATTPIQTGDLLMIVQMQDASINSTNTSAYGDGVTGDPGSGANNLNSAGLYEYIVATNTIPVGGGNLTFVGEGTSSGLINTYRNQNFSGQGQQRYQILRVPQYSDSNVGAGLTVLPWNGIVGGVLALDVSGQLNMNGNTIDVSSLGFRGGGGRRLTGGTGGTDTDYRNLSTRNFHASKGEGIAGTPRYIYNGTPTLLNTGVEGYPNGSYGRGAPGNAGGGGNDGNVARNDQNSGGGGGSNGGRGGTGGYAWSSQDPVGGFGGKDFLGSAQRLVLGGGGGAGTRNNSTGIQSSGGRGGGIVHIRTKTLTGAGTINANGESGIAPANDGGGGGGAGGSVLVTAQQGGLSTLTINAQGADGSDAWPNRVPTNNNNSHGPGGGGGGGFVLYAAPDSAPIINVSAGTNGTSTTSQDPFGAEPGENGQNNLINPDDIPGTNSGASCSAPKLLLIKRITAINGNRIINPNDNTPLNQFVDDTSSSQQTDDNNPGWPNGYLTGEFNAGLVRPGDEIEYTIYFLNAGGGPALEVQICDRIQSGQLFQPAAFPSGVDAELQLGSSPILNQTAANDSSDRTQLIAPNVTPPSTCTLGGPNDNGTLVLNLTGNPGTGLPNLPNLPRSTGPGTPNNSYGLFRFRTRVNA